MFIRCSKPFSFSKKKKGFWKVISIIYIGAMVHNVSDTEEVCVNWQEVHILEIFIKHNKIQDSKYKISVITQPVMRYFKRYSKDHEKEKY